jgi:hypothetical protein
MQHDRRPERDTGEAQVQPGIREKHSGGRIIDQNSSDQPKLARTGCVAPRQPAGDAESEQCGAKESGDEERLTRSVFDPKEHRSGMRSLTDHPSRLDWWRRQVQRLPETNLTIADFSRQHGVRCALARLDPSSRPRFS